MSETDGRREGRPDDLIELESPDSGQAAASADRTDSPPQEEPPIPPRPLHLCPNCDYNLTGLTSRRCPECGEQFTLSDAKFRGFELSEGGQEYRQWMRKDRLVLGLGIALLVFGLCCPCVSHNRLSGGLQLSPSLKTWVMWMVSIPGVAMMLLVNLYYEQRWSRAVLTLGIAVTILGLIVAML